MFTLHGTLITTEQQENTFFFWGEKPPSSKKTSPLKNNEFNLHPFLARPGDVEGMITQLGPQKTASYQLMRLQAYSTLPSAEGCPLFSGDMPVRQDGPADRREATPGLWKIKGIGMRLEDAFEFLAFLDESRKTAGQNTIGADIRYWSKVSKLTLELMIRQSIIPEIIESKGGKARVRWRYVLTDELDRERHSILARSMPPVSIAVYLKADERRKSDILDFFINSAINDIILSRVKGPGVKLAKNSTASKWMDSLQTGKELQLSSSVLKSLRSGTAHWKAAADAAKKRAFRTCFVLSPPDGDDAAGPWQLKYYIQASDDPSLLVPADKIWNESGRTLNYLNRKFENPQDRLLEDLGNASRIFPQMESSLHAAKPASAAISAGDAYAFLKEAALLFKDNGYGVILPDWWSKGIKGLNLGVKLTLRPKETAKTSKGMMSLESIAEYDWMLAIGDESVSEAEFRRLSKLKVPLVQVRGKWVLLEKDDIEKVLRIFNSSRAGEMMISDMLKLSTGLGDFQGLPVRDITCSGWLTGLFDGLRSPEKITDLPAPKGFEGTLRPYQIKGYSWLWFMKRHGVGIILADDMGLGKTIQVLALLAKEKNDGIKGTALLICPMSVTGNWVNEANKFTPGLRVHLHHGTGRDKKEDFIKKAKNCDLLISTYALAHRDCELFREVGWKAVILDEAQNIKNPFARQSQAVKSLNAGYRIALTGTPVENRSSELWSIMDFLNPGYLGALEKFRKEFAIPIERYDDASASGRLKQAVRPFMLRRVKTDRSVIKDLPDKIEIKERCNLTKEQATLYEAVVEDMLGSIGNKSGIERKGLVLAALMRLKQVCDHPALYIRGVGPENDARRSGKLGRLTEMLEEALSEGDKALVFTQFVGMGEIMKAHFEAAFGVDVMFLCGGTPRKSREKMISRFSEANGPGIFILSLKAGGTGLNLTRANHVFHYDRWWNPAVEDQATDRAFRIGQTKNVMVHKFVCEGTLEERIDEMIESKKALAKNIIGSGEDWITELSTDQLREMLTLRRETVPDEAMEAE